MATDVNNVNELDDREPTDAVKPSENGSGTPVQPSAVGGGTGSGGAGGPSASGDRPSPATRTEVLMSVQNLQKYFPVRGGVLQRVVGQVKAVDGVNFDVYRGETLGLVGESGCGKTTVGRTVLRLLNPTGGKVMFEGRDIMSLNSGEMKKARRNMQIIFQDPYSSLDPRVPIGQSVGEGLLIHGVSREEREVTVREMLKRVGLHPEHARRYPHEFSGGQRQRIGIARALTMHPSFIVADEPVSALDVSIQSQVLNILKDLQREFSLTYLFIAHNLSVVEHISDRVGVMYLGKMAELADRDELFNNPRHPYTQALLSAIPIPDPRIRRQRIILKGDVPSPLNPPSGCRFHTRCWLAQQICSDQEPEWRDIGSENGTSRPHLVACHFAEQTKVKGLADEIKEQIGTDGNV